MGKRLQKLLHGIVPSWLSKIKAPSTDLPARKMLPFSRAEDRKISANKSPSLSTPPQSSRALVLGDDKNTFQDDDSSILAATPPVQRKKSKAQKEGRRLHEQSHDSPADERQRYPSKLQELLSKEEIFLQSEREHHDGTFAEVPHEHSAKQSHRIGKGLDHMKDGVRSSRDEDQVCKGNLGFYKTTHRHILQTADDKGNESMCPGQGAPPCNVEMSLGNMNNREKSFMSYELPESICNIVGNGTAVVEQSLNPHLALWESMMEMILGNGLWEWGTLEFLLDCYLSLNEPHIHPVIHSSFLEVLEDLQNLTVGNTSGEVDELFLE